MLGGVDPTGNLAAFGIPGCLGDGESSLPVRKELASGSTLTSLVGYTLNFNTLDNNKNPTDGLLIDFRQDFAGVGGDVTYLKSAVDGKYYTPLVADIVGLIHLQAGALTKIGNNDIRMLDHFQMGPNLVRGFAPNGIGPRDLTFFPYTGFGDALGGTKYWGASAELQMPFWFLPKEVGLKGAVYADAGSLFDYQGPTSNVLTGEVNVRSTAILQMRDGVRQQQRRPHLGGRRPDLGVAVRAAALRLCGADHQGRSTIAYSNSSLAAELRSEV